MALKLGGTFMGCAMGPVNYAGACIQASRMPEGIQELAPAGLLGGFQRGVEQAAQLAGVRVAEVERMLPTGEVRDAIAKLDVSHGAAMRAWSVHAGQLGGLLQGVAELTVDGRAPDASLCLERLAKKVQRDADFSEPLQALADDVGRWQELLTHCRALLDENGGGALARAYRRRRLRKAAAIGVSGLLVVAALSVIAYVRAARARVDTALVGADPCAVRSVAEDDFARASSDQRAALVERLAACSAREAREAREREEKLLAEERAAKEQRAREARDARCEALAAHLKTGALSPEDEGDALLRRLAKKKLLAADVGPDGPELPCLGARGGDVVLAAFADALVASVWTWVPSGDPSAKVGEALVPRRDDVPGRAKTMLAVRAEIAARRAITSGDALTIARATRLCALTRDLEIAGATACAQVPQPARDERAAR